MIKKERLEELIEQGAIIYVVCWGKVKELNLNDVEYMEVEDDDVYYEIADNTARTTDLEHLFETKEEAEWHKEFGCIERTERLELPTWEEVSRDLENASIGTYIIREFDDYIFFVLFRRSGKKEIYIRSTIGEEFWEFTKENYTLACRKAKSLFLGAENE